MTEPRPLNDVRSRSDPCSPKKRKIRKGTLSCWECKRRKIRCHHSSPSTSTCDGCKSRGTKCVGQEYQDDTASTASPLAQAKDMTRLGLDPSTANDSGTICRNLRSLWPDQHDLEVISSVLVDTSVLSHGLVCTPLSKRQSETELSTPEILQLPSNTSHPVAIARKLLSLAVLLQTVSPKSVAGLAGLTFDYVHQQHTIIRVVNKLVTSNDNLTNSLEGIEIIMIESMYHNNAGNLRRAWLLNRRAMLLAQMMRLQNHEDDSRLPRGADETTASRLSSRHMWFRIVCSDRYLSLMLGLPLGSADESFAAPEEMEACTPTERLERTQALAGGRIVQCDGSKTPDRETTRKIDQLLQDAAALLPAKWWLNPGLDHHPDEGIANNVLGTTMRYMLHFTQYHLLTRLHLPYMLQSPNEDYAHSRVMAMNSSREALALFLAFRSPDSPFAYCRGVDFIMFVASTVLCLAHIQEVAQQQHDHHHRDIPAQQRLSDRAVMERTLEIMDGVAQSTDDAIACKIRDVLGHLLDIEEDAARGGRHYSASTDPAIGEEFHSESEGKELLSIKIPYFGTIRIESGGAPPLSAYSDGNTENVDWAVEDGWPLQGIDMALFDSLSHGCSNDVPLGFQDTEERTRTSLLRRWPRIVGGTPDSWSTRSQP